MLLTCKPGNTGTGVVVVVVVIVVVVVAVLVVVVAVLVVVFHFWSTHKNEFVFKVKFVKCTIRYNAKSRF